MKEFHALPTEERILKLNNAQWLWLYFNIVEDRKNKSKEKEAEIDYLTYFMNYDLAKIVIDKKKNNKETGKYDKYEKNAISENERYNDEFEDEINQYLKDEKFVELPSDNYKYSTESKEDFIDRALAFEQFINENDVQNIDDLYDKVKNKQKINNKNNTKEIDKNLQQDLDNDLDVFFVPEDN